MRALRVLLILAVVLGGILVGVDRLAVAYVESEAAGKVRFGTVRPESTDVDIKGFPFLTQIAGRRFDEVDVKLTGVQTSAGGQSIRIGELTAELRDVTLDGDYAIDRARTADGTALIGYADLAAASGHEAKVEYGEGGKLKVTGGVRVLGRMITRTVTSTVTLVNGNTLRVRADSVPGEGMPGLEQLIRSRTDFDRRVEGLPKGMRLTKVEPRPDGLAVMVAGENVALTAP
ncbi:LmeA family phospholipid-binding protein [Streptomyces laurentii]|uniref:LmeA family phospholipid-binding protein n=1 Tax=Streptomyces laurentii TaxID=39478 RepID=UPI00369FBA2B